MEKGLVHAEHAGPPFGPYSPGLRAGPFLFISGQVPSGPDGRLVDGDFDTQAAIVFQNLAAIAEAGGSSLAHAVQVGVYLQSRDDFERMNELFAEHFPAPPPARTTIQANLPGFAIEIDAILLVPDA